MSVLELTQEVEKLLENTPLNVELESDYDGTDLLIQWGRWEVYDEDDFEGYDEEEKSEEVEGKIEREDLDSLLSKTYTYVKQNHDGFVEHGTSDVSEGVYRIRIH